MTARTASFFDRYAADFDAIYGNSNGALDWLVNRLFRRSMLIRYQQTLERCRPIEGCSVIDIGCGPGHYSVALARAGAARVFGLDFAPGMLKLASEAAEAAGVAQRCSFALGDFLHYPIPEKFDYAVVMGFMDYVAEPRPVIDRVVSIVRKRGFFSFPKAGGLLAWQRQVRYRNRCDLFLYGEKDIDDLLKTSAASYTIELIGRDFFVTVEPRSSA